MSEQTYVRCDVAVVDRVPDDDEIDSRLVEACVSQDDPAAFDGLVTRHRNRVFRLALSVLGPASESDAQDIVQEVFMRVSRHVHDFRGESSFRTWLYRLTLNLSLDRLRARARRPRTEPDASLDDCPTTSRADDPFWLTEAAERTRAIGECLDVLPSGLRSVIQLRYWDDLTVDEIAAMLRIPAGTVKSQLHYGRKFLYQAIQAKGLRRE